MSEKVRTIEWEMMDKRKFIPLNLAGSFALTASAYPFSLVKTRLQVQHGLENYGGAFDAFVKIAKYEGIRGFYKGFLVSCFGLISGTGYIMTYEAMRSFLSKRGIEDSSTRGFIAGGIAALIGRTFANPLEIVTQRMMIMGQRKGINDFVKIPENVIRIKVDKRNALRAILSVISSMAKADGIKGFYRGFFMSLTTTVPAGALWWFFYHNYQGNSFYYTLIVSKGAKEYGKLVREDALTCL
ncbi:hypothetical protein QYM36_011066 [Artemia franciscana]|uniref:Uncharacterized protein n=1 Tax=Artemia franciscana TaxID=6661 RepID=A0AA88HMI8_ARTSF|nr:hypothetical protein QYM36_011066 [Artemia franciscana]